MHSHMVSSYRFFGGGYRFTMVWCTFRTQLDPPLLKVVYACFDRISCVYIYIIVYMEVSIHGGTPKWMVYNGKSYKN